jgi:hypothetical protein
VGLPWRRMSVERRGVSIVLVVVMVAVLVSDVVAATVVGDGDEPRHRGGLLTAARPSTTLPVSPDGSEATTSPTAIAAATTIPTVPGALAGPGTTVAITSAAPGPAQPPRPGRYTYRVTDKTTEGSSTDTSEYDGAVIIETIGPRERQRQRTESDGEVMQVQEVSWRPDGLFAERDIFPADPEDPKGRDATCDWDPDLLLIRLPARSGTTWPIDSHCTATGATPEETLTLGVKGTGRIVGNETTTVGGTAVAVVRIHIEITTSFSGSEGTDSGTLVVDQLFSPDRGIIVEDTQTTHESFDDPDSGEHVDFTNVTTFRLAAVDPR